MLIGPTLTFIRPLITLPSNESTVAPGMQGATFSTSSSTSHARSLVTGTVNECSSSISLSSRCCCQRSAGQHLGQVAPVVGRTAQVCRWFGPIGRGPGSPGLSYMPVRSPGQSGHADDRPGLRRPVELLVTIAPVASQFGHPYPAQGSARLMPAENYPGVLHQSSRRDSM